MQEALEEVMTNEELAQIWQQLHDWDVERFLDEDYKVECDCEACSFLRTEGLLEPDGTTTEKGRVVRAFGQALYRRTAKGC